MKKKVKRALFLLLAVSLLCSGTVLPSRALAADDPGIVPYGSSYLDGYGGSCVPQGNGKIGIAFDVSGTDTLNYLGVKDIRLWASSDGGSSWYIAKEYHWTDYPTMMGRMVDSYASGILYSGTAGYRYYAEINFWGGSSSTNGDLRTFTTFIKTAT